MKKVILVCTMMLFLMSFTKVSNINNDEDLFSPECFQYADDQTAWKSSCAGFKDDIDEFEYWERAYNDCEKVTSFDEFQFPN